MIDVVFRKRAKREDIEKVYRQCIKRLLESECDYVADVCSVELFLCEEIEYSVIGEKENIEGAVRGSCRIEKIQPSVISKDYVGAGEGHGGIVARCLVCKDYIAVGNFGVGGMWRGSVEEMKKWEELHNRECGGIVYEETSRGK